MTDDVKLVFLANGKSIHIKRWSTHFALKGYDVHLITFTAKPIKGVKIHELRYFGKLAYPIRIRNIRKAVEKINPDILHAHYMSHYGIYGALTGFHPYIVSVWGSDVLRTPQESKTRRIGVSYALNRADYITTTAEFMKGYLIEAFDLPQNKIVRIPWGIDLETFHRGYRKEVRTAKRSLKIETNAPIILSNRHMEPKYEIEDIVRAIPHVLKSHSDAIFVFIRGIGSPEFESKIKRKAQKLGVANNTRFISKHVTPKEMAIYLNMANAFLSIPKTDQFGGSVMEGMACGSIPVVSDIEVYYQYLKNETNALFVNPESPKEMGEKIIYAIRHPEIRDDYYLINRKIVEEKEDWGKNAKKMEELYRQVLGKTRK
ncbi:MAG: glycosyltransferase family 4 protein [Candidatus Bathyarchaeota archaeon]